MFCKIGVFEILQNSQESNCARVSFWIKFSASGLPLKRDSGAEEHLFYRTPLVAASVFLTNLIWKKVKPRYFSLYLDWSDFLWIFIVEPWRYNTNSSYYSSMVELNFLLKFLFIPIYLPFIYRVYTLLKFITLIVHQALF